MSRDFVPLYSNYDKSVVDWIRRTSWQDHRILAVFATPERAFARVKDVLTIREGTDANITVVPLPFFSIDRSAQIFDPTRYVKFDFRREWVKRDNGKFIWVKRPRPEKLTYEVTLWARNLEDLENVYGQFVGLMERDYTWIRVNHPFPFGYMTAYLRMLNPRYDRNIKPVGDQRVLRRVFVFEIEGFICYVPSEVGRILSINIDICESEDLEICDTLMDSYSLVGDITTGDVAMV